MNFLVALDCLIAVTEVEGSHADDIIQNHLDEVMGELMELGARDPSIDLDLTCGQVSFSVLVEGSNPLEAVDEASSLVRSAIHAAGGATPNWPGPTDDVWAVQLVAVRSAPVDESCDPDPDEELVPA